MDGAGGARHSVDPDSASIAISDEAFEPYSADTANGVSRSLIGSAPSCRDESLHLPFSGCNIGCSGDTDNLAHARRVEGWLVQP